MNGSRAAVLVAGLVVVTWSHPVRAQHPGEPSRWADSARSEIAAATATADVERLESVEILLDRALTAFPEDPLLLHYKGYAIYRKALFLGARSSDEERHRLLQQAERLLRRSAEGKPLPESHAVRSTIFGRLIGTSSNPLAGVWYGPKSSAAMDEALALGPENPRVWLLRGVNARFTPSIWGGGLDRARQYLRKAIVLFEADSPAPPAPSWGHAEAYYWLGRIHEEEGDTRAALDAYRRALELEPENVWIRGRLSSLER